MIQNIKQLLKRLSALDLVLLLVGMCAAGYALVYFSTRPEYVYVDLTSQMSDYNAKEMGPIGYQEADAISVGDGAFNSFGQQKATVVDKSTVNYGGVNRYIWITLKIRAKYNKRLNIYSYNDSPILIGNSLSLTLGRVAFKGRILNIYKNEQDRYKNFQRKNVIVTLLFRGMEPSYAESMRNFEAKNSKNETVAKTVSYSDAPQEVDVPTDKGFISHGFSTIYKDVTLKALLPNVPCSLNTCFFNNTIDLKIGIKNFWIHSDKTFLSNGIITDIQFADDL